MSAPSKPIQFGRYEAFQRIAAGGMATVYAGRARGPAGFQRLVAIKVMHEHIADDPEFSAMFLDEARLAAAIRHPNVVPTLDVSEDGRFLVMELVEGASLRDVIRANRQSGEVLSLPSVLRIVLDALEGLQAAHELLGPDGQPLHLVHRDVSPHNVLIGKDGITRITDFGIAYAEERLTVTRSGTLKGKMPYMAPEQIEGGACDRRVDVYAMGCVLWETLTGERLFRAPNEAALARRIVDGIVAGPRTMRSEVPPAIDAVCMNALGPLADRYPTAAAFAEALERAAEEAGVRVARPRVVAALTDGIRLEIEHHGERVPPTVHTPRLEGSGPHRAERAGKDTVDEDEVNDLRRDLPAAARPVAVGALHEPEAPSAPTRTPLRGGAPVPESASGTLPLAEAPPDAASTLPEAGHEEASSAPADSAEAQILAMRDAARRGELAVSPGVEVGRTADTAAEQAPVVDEDTVVPAGVPRSYPWRAVIALGLVAAGTGLGLWLLPGSAEGPPKRAASARPVDSAPPPSSSAPAPSAAPPTVAPAASVAPSSAPTPSVASSAPTPSVVSPAPWPRVPVRPPSPPPPPPPPPAGGEFVPDRL